MTDLATHVTRLNRHLERFREAGVLHMIDGRAQSSADTFDTHSPVDDSLICPVARGTVDDVDAAATAATAATAARKAFPAWAGMSGEQRKRILHRIADLIVERAEEIALCECWDTGQAYRFMSRAALRGAENFRYYADSATSARDGQSLPTTQHLNVISRSPSVRSVSSHRGIRRSCCPPGRSHLRLPQAVPWCTSRLNSVP